MTDREVRQINESLLDAIASGEVTRIIAVVDPAFKKAAKKASERAHRKGTPVADGRADRRED